MTHDFDLNDLIRILAACPEYDPGHPLGQPFMSAYQIAIRLPKPIQTILLSRALTSAARGPGRARA